MSGQGWRCVGGPWDGKLVTRSDGHTTFEMEEISGCRRSGPTYRTYLYRLTPAGGEMFYWRCDS